MHELQSPTSRLLSIVVLVFLGIVPVQLFSCGRFGVRVSVLGTLSLRYSRAKVMDLHRLRLLSFALSLSVQLPQIGLSI